MNSLKIKCRVMVACSMVIAATTSCSSYHSIIRSDNGIGLNLLALRQPRKNACASTCLFIVATHWGLLKSMEEIESELGDMPDGGYTLKQLRDWARNNSLNAYVVKGDMDILREHTEKGRPIIATIKISGKSNHSLVIESVEYDEEIWAMDPSKGHHVAIPKEEFLRQWKLLDNPMLIIAPGVNSEWNRAE